MGCVAPGEEEKEEWMNITKTESSLPPSKDFVIGSYAVPDESCPHSTVGI